jgi:hypothetical protein
MVGLMKRLRFVEVMPALMLSVCLVACGGEDDAEGEAKSVTCDASTSTCVVLGIYSESGGSYTDLNKDLTFSVGATCESWSRWTEVADSHSSERHLHYNAHRDSTYENGTFTWYEYGPEANQADIDATCAAASEGAMKTANETDYIADKNFFVRIKSVTGPNM